jgi:hypothetical protein
MWEWLSNANNLKGLGSVISGVSGLYTGIQNNKIAKDQNNLTRQQFDLEKSAYNRATTKQDNANSDFSLASSEVFGSALNNKKKKNGIPQFDLVS